MRGDVLPNGDWFGFAALPTDRLLNELRRNRKYLLSIKPHPEQHPYADREAAHINDAIGDLKTILADREIDQLVLLT